MIGAQEPTVRVALVGAGDVAGRHMVGWWEADGGDVDVVVDVDAERARSFADRWTVARTATDLSEVAGDPDIDAADICLPPHLHAMAVRAFVEHGKHVLVEKPLATTVGEALDLKATVEHAGVVGMVAENWPFATATQQVAALVADGKLGDLFLVKSVHESAMFADLDAHARRHPWGLDAPGGGYLLRAGIHGIALAREFFGEYASLYACTTGSRGFERAVPDTDTVVAATFRSGAAGSFTCTGRSSHVGPRRMQLTFFGTAGQVWFDVLSGEVVATVNGVETTTRSSNASLGYVEEIQHFVDCVRTGVSPRTGFAQQIGGLAATLAAYRSLDEGRPVSPDELFPLPSTAEESGERHG